MEKDNSLSVIYAEFPFFNAYTDLDNRKKSNSEFLSVLFDKSSHDMTLNWDD